MKQLVSALLLSLGAITKVIVVMFVEWFMFAVLEISIFQDSSMNVRIYDIETLDNVRWRAIRITTINSILIIFSRHF